MRLKLKLRRIFEDGLFFCFGVNMMIPALHFVKLLSTFDVQDVNMLLIHF